MKAYGKKLLGAVKDMFKIIHLYARNIQADDRENFDTETFKRAMEHAREKIIAAALDNAPPQLDENGGKLKRGPFNMVNRFRKNGEACFVFITTPGCEPTNNLTEQAVRFVAIDRHITKGTRGEKRRKTKERLWTVVNTCALQECSAAEFIFTAVHTHFRG